MTAASRGERGVDHARRAAAASFGALLLIYLVTLAPGLTFWDAGEFIAAVHTYGIPHPPGTPLYIALARAWREALPMLSTALATNALSALCTAASGAVLAWLLARAVSWPWAALSAVTAGTMSTVWLNATETEVYAASLLLAMLTIGAADVAGRTGRGAWLALTGYATALSVPLHLSALAATPAAALLASLPSDGGRPQWRRGIIVAGVAVGAAGVALGQPVVLLAGVAALAGAGLGGSTKDRMAALGAALAAVVALSALAMLPLRARHDPLIDVGHPVTWRATLDVVARRQYASPGLWPRQAALWIQLGNLFEYADWQVALGLSPSVGPSWWRTPITLFFGALAVVGAASHRRLDRRTFRAFAVLFAATSVGLVLYLNLKAGASFGWGVLPDDAPHEVRDRDYFFALAFWTAGAWAGLGVATIGARVRPPMRYVAAALTLLPLALNWRAVDRRLEPDASLPERFGRALLFELPQRTVLFTGGDNDTFPLWYLQAARGERPDVTVIVVPLLNASWYRAQLARRDSLLDARDSATAWAPTAVVRRIALAARSRQRPVRATLSTDSTTRLALGRPLSMAGLTLADTVTASDLAIPELAVSIDTAASRRFVRAFGAPTSARIDGVDPAPEEALELLSCPLRTLGATPDRARVDSLASACNLR